jgi:hypothetical protein
MDFLVDGDRRYLPFENGYFIQGSIFRVYIRKLIYNCSINNDTHEYKTYYTKTKIDHIIRKIETQCTVFSEVAELKQMKALLHLAKEEHDFQAKGRLLKR